MLQEAVRLSTSPLRYHQDSSLSRRKCTSSPRTRPRPTRGFQVGELTGTRKKRLEPTTLTMRSRDAERLTI